MCTFGYHVHFNVSSFRRSAAFCEYFVCKYLNVTVNGQVQSSSKSMTSCATKMALSRAWSAAPCNFTGYGPTLPQEECTDAQDCAWYIAYRFSASLHCYSEWTWSVASFADTIKPFSNERRPYLLDVKSSDAALHSIWWHLQTNPTSTASSAPLQLPYTIMVYWLTPYILEYFNTTNLKTRKLKIRKI